MFSFRPNRHATALTLAAASWGFGTVASKRALDELPPLVLLPIQLAASLVALAVLMRWRGQPFSGVNPVLGRLGILNPGLAYALSLVGLTSITASLSVLLWALEPLVILLLAGMILGERIGRGLVALSIVAAGGMAMVVYAPALGGAWLGIALTVAGIGCCAVYAVLARRWIGTADSTIQVVAVQQAYALAFAIVVVVLAGALSGGVDVGPVSAIAWASALGSGLLYYAAAYWFYLTALRNVPASIAAVSFYLVPLFGVAAGFALLDERLSPLQLAGGVVVLGAVVAIGRLRSAASDGVF